MSSIVKLEQIQVRTRGIGHFAEITREIEACVDRAGVHEGIALVRSRHTTAAITCNEPDPRLHEDMRDAVYDTFPASRRYRHIEEGPENAVAHLATAMLFGESTWVPVRGGRLDLGTWQHVYLVELYEPRTRTVDVAVLGE
ncbi:MAG: YjbQ family protein [Chloroflexi bacterium]|nr:YjbQ family protein [Chloroflexota bacterium]